MAPPKKMVNPGKIFQEVYSLGSKANRTAEAGLYLSPMVGALNTARQIPSNSTIVVYNSDTAVHYVKFGASDVAAPSSALTGIPCPPGVLTVLGTGPNTYVRSDSATVFGYTTPADPVTHPTTYP